MKISPFFLMVLLVTLFTLNACTPSEEDVHPKRRSSRSENLKRYMPRAQELRAQAQLRAKSIVNGPLLGGDELKNFIPKTTPINLSSYLLAQQQALQEMIRSSASQEAVEEVSKLLAGLEKETLEAVASADSAPDLAQQLRNFADRYSRELTALAENVKQDSWTVPSAQQSRQARVDLQKSGEELFSQIKELYGNTCAQKARPVLAKVGDDYWLALSSIKNPEEFKQTLTQTGQEANAALEKIIEAYGDPKVSLSEDNTAALRARLIEAHQGIEQQFEKLYSKEAVLKTRDIFESYLEGTDHLFQTPGRLSEKMASFEALGSTYRQKITALQVQLNDELEQKIATAGASARPAKTKSVKSYEKK